jgi:hypothetical protein
MELPVALAVVFFCVLLLASAAIACLLVRYCLAALRRRRRRTDDPEAAPRRRRAVGRAVVTTTTTPHQQQPAGYELALSSESPPPAAAGAAAAKKQEEPRRLAWREVEALTGGFDEAAVVGRGGSSTVYLARLRGGAPVAVKVHRWCGGERRLRAFRQELGLLRRLRHPHIVALLAYSDDHGACARARAQILAFFNVRTPHVSLIYSSLLPFLLDRINKYHSSSSPPMLV